jgi:hypothetical protein
MDSTMLKVWDFFTDFPPSLAGQMGSAITALSVITAVLIVFWRRRVVMTASTQWTPLALYGLSLGVRWFAEWRIDNGSSSVGWLWIMFSLLMLTALIWALVNLVRVVLNK